MRLRVGVGVMLKAGLSGVATWRPGGQVVKGDCDHSVRVSGFADREKIFSSFLFISQGGVEREWEKIERL